MDPVYRTPLIDLFRKGDVDKAIRLLGAQGALALRAHEQLALLMILLEDPDSDVAGKAEETIAALPLPALSAFLARGDVSETMRSFFASRGYSRQKRRRREIRARISRSPCSTCRATVKKEGRPTHRRRFSRRCR